MTLEFAFRIEKGANMAYDTETGEAGELYTIIKLENCKTIAEEEYAEAHKELADKLFGVPTEYVTPISMKEYFMRIKVE